MDIIDRRRSVRKFSDRPVEKEVLERIIRAGMQAPSAHNTQPWEFLVVTDQEDRKTVAGMSPYAKMAANAPALIIVCCDRSRGLEDQEGNCWWVQDLSACTENILLQIVEEQLGGVWLGFYPDQGRVRMVKEYFNLPEQIVPFSVVALGYGEQENRFTNRFSADKIHYGNY